jgi:transmembrane sensor
MGSQKVRVTGTVFDVIRTADRLRVTVAEGRVHFADPVAEREASLSAGDQLVYSAGVGMRLQRVDPSLASSWQHGYLVYKKATLADIVDDLNRYFARKVVIADAAASNQTFSGVLRIDGEEVVLNRLSHLLPVRPEYRDRVVLLRSVAARE